MKKRNWIFGDRGRATRSQPKGLKKRRLSVELLEPREMLSAAGLQPEAMYYLKPIISGAEAGTAVIASATGDYRGGGTPGSLNGSSYTVVLDEGAAVGQTVKLELYVSILGLDGDPTNDGFLKGALNILNRPDATPLVGKPSQLSLLPEFKEFGYSKGKVQGDLDNDGGLDLGGPINVSGVPDSRGSWVIPCAMTNPVFGSGFNGNGWVDIKLGTFTFTIGSVPVPGASTQLWAQPVVNSGLKAVHTFIADTTNLAHTIGTNGGDVRWGPAVTIVMAGKPDSGTAEPSDATTVTDTTPTDALTDDKDSTARLLAAWTPNPRPTGDRPSSSSRMVVLAAYTPAPILDHSIPELVPFVEGLRQIQADILSDSSARPSYWGEQLTAGGGEYRLHLNDNGMLIRQWIIDWGDGSEPQTVPNQPWVVHRYPGGAGQYRIAVTASSLNGTYSGGNTGDEQGRDSIGGANDPMRGDDAEFDSGSATLGVQAENVPPVLRVVANRQADEGQMFHLPQLGIFTHAAVAGDFTYEIDWGDGSTPDSGMATIRSQGSQNAPLIGSFGGRHAYAAAGIYYVAATITDPNGGSDTQTFAVTVERNARPLPALVAPSGLDAMEVSAGGVRYAGGEVVLTVNDLGLGTARTYTNLWRSQGAADLGVGLGWQLDESPYVVRTADGAAVVFGAQQSLWFAQSGNDYSAKFGAKELLSHDAENHLLTLVEPDGTIYQFDDFSFSGPRMGQFRRMVAPGGQTVEVTGWAFDGRIAEMQWRASAAAVPYEMRLYVYLREGANAGRLESVEVWRNEAEDAPAWQRVRKVIYAYYGESEDHGLPGNLKTATLQFFGLGPSGHYDWIGDQVAYCRYYTSGDAAGLLKMVVSPQGFADADAALQPYSTGTPYIADDADLDDFSSRYYQYDSSGRVIEATIGGLYTHTYDYAVSSAADGYNLWKHKTTEHRPDGSDYTVYANFLGQVLLTDLEDGESNHWFTFREYGDDGYNDALLTKLAMPSAVAGYSECAAGTFDMTFTNSGDSGLVYCYTYYSSGAAGYLEYEQVQEGWNGTPINLAKYEYTSHSSGGASVHPLSALTVYPDGSAAVTTTYAYTWYEDTVQVKERKTTLPTVSEDQNGSGEPAAQFEYYDAAGKLVWTADERGRFTHYEYSGVTGLVETAIADVDDGAGHALPEFDLPDWPVLPIDGLHQATDYEYDLLGRVTQVLGPAHNAVVDGAGDDVRTAAWVRYFDAGREIRSVSGYATLGEGAAIAAWALVNPVAITKYDRDGRMTDEIEAASGGSATIDGKKLEDLDLQSFGPSSYTRRTTYAYNAAGQLTATNVYTIIYPEWPAFSVFSATEYGYDSLGRLNRTRTPGEVITRTLFDVRGLVTSVWVGTDDDTNGYGEWSPSNAINANLVEVTSYVYDNDLAGGDGNLTSLVRRADANAANDRTTSFGYDWRNRLSYIVLPADEQGRVTYTLLAYDNLDRVTKTQHYHDDDDDVLNGGPEPYVNGAGDEDVLLAQDETRYDNLAQVYRKVAYGVEDGIPGDALVDNFWYDAAGNLVKSHAGGTQQFTKRQYDGLGRPVAVYVGYDVDEPIGAAGTLTEALDVAGDTIFAQTDYAYNAAGKTIFVTGRERLPNATGEGALTGGNARTSYLGYWYDAVGRQIATADYGAPAAAPTRGDDPPERSDSVLVTTALYNARGELQSTFDPNGRETRTIYDNAGRVKTVIQNFKNGNPADGQSDEDIVTEYGYNPQHLVSAVTVTTRDNIQTTRYVYGTDVGDAGPAIYRNDWVRAVIYADSDDSYNRYTHTISDGGDGYDRVEYTYNRLGEVVAVKDQNQTVHEYLYDRLGRQVADKVTLAQGSPIDASVLRIERSYDVRGLLEKVTSFSDPDGGANNIVNQVQFAYNAFGLLATEHQEHDGAVDGNTLWVGYEYATAAQGLRPTAVVYPNGRYVRFDYGDGTADDYLNRVQEIRDDDQSTLAAYTYLGLGRIVAEDFAEPQVKLDYTAAGALDQFGRVVDQVWQRYGANPETLESFRYGYDRAGNRLWRENLKATGRDLDELYAYDELYRLIGAQRGDLVENQQTGEKEIDGSTFAQQWNLDGLGNWAGFNEGTAVGTWTLEQQRDVNAANEISNITEGQGQTQWATPVYDKAGNMTSLPQPGDPENSFTLVYDAWNRLVRVAAGETTVAEYVYDGLNRRIVRVVGSTCEHFYHAGRSVVETREGDSLAAPQQPKHQYVWSLRYVDAPVLRDVYDGQGERQDDQRVYYLTDANHNVTALVGLVEVGQGQFAWQVVERYVYTPYGEVTVWDATWTNTQSPAGFANTVLFTGRELDPATGLYYYDARWYGPHFGQFVSRDVIVSADANPYRYVRSSPVNFPDPSGRGPCGQPVWDADLGRYVDPLYEQWAAEARQRQRPVRQASSEPGFWQGYWYYLWNPSKMDRDLRIAQKVALGTAAVAGGGAAGLAAGGAVTTWVAAGGAPAIEASTAGSVVGVSVGSTTGYLIGRPLGTDVANVGALGGGLIGGFAPAVAPPRPQGMTPAERAAADEFFGNPMRQPEPYVPPFDPYAPRFTPPNDGAILRNPRPGGPIPPFSNN